MRDIIIYKAEASVEGLVEKITKGTVLAYVMPLEKWQPTPEDENRIKSLDLVNTTAGERDNDLYYTKSVLVTTNWNKNDDVFDKVETWSARHTPSHKPTNVEHDEKKMVGHITDCWAMNTEGQIIPDNTIVDDLPNIYHLVNGAVIYKGWKDTELASRANILIEQIEKGEKYVSMECAFTNFGYAIVKSDGSCHIVNRDEDTAWMTKHLRAYGGTGEHEGYKIGRLLRNITFSGKGYVDKPANPDSIIFSNASIFNFTSATQENPLILNNGVYLNSTENKEKNNMASEIDTLKAQLDEMKISLQKALDDKVAAEEKLAKVDTEKTLAHITELETQLNETKAQVDEWKKIAEDARVKIGETEKNLAEIKTTNDSLTKELANMQHAQLIANRISTLIEGGIEREIAEKKVNLYVNLADEQFTDLARDLIDADAAKKAKPKEKMMMTDEEMKEAGMTPEEMKKKKAEMMKNDSKADDDDTNADTQTLEDAKVEVDANLSIASEDNVDDTRKELQKALANRLGIEIDKENNNSDE